MVIPVCIATNRAGGLLQHGFTFCTGLHPSTRHTYSDTSFFFLIKVESYLVYRYVCVCVCVRHLCTSFIKLPSSFRACLLSLVCMLHTVWLWATTGTSVPAGSLLQGIETACRSPGNSLCKSGPFLSFSKLSLPQDRDQVPKGEERWERGMVQGHGVPRNPGR